MILSSIPPLVTPIAYDLTLTYSQTGFILGTVALVYIPLAVHVGVLIDRVGTKPSIMVGITLVSLSGFLQSFATNFETLFLTVCILGVGGSFISVGSPKTVASWFFGKDRGAASGIYATSGFIGGSTALAITNTLILPLAGTWRNSLRLYGLLGSLIAFIWLLFARHATHAQTGETKPVPQREAITKLLREKHVWIVATMSFSSFFAGQGFRRWLPKLLELKGMSPASSGLLASVPGWCGLMGSAIIPGLGKAGSRKPIVFVTLLVQGICIIIAGIAMGLPLIASLVLYGISYTATGPLLIVILMDMPQIGAEYMGAASGMVFSLGKVGSFVGPLMVGFLLDLTGSILSGVVAITAVVETMLIFTLLMKEK